MKQFERIRKWLVCSIFVNTAFLCSAQSKITFDSTYFSAFRKNFVPYTKETAPTYIFEPKTYLNTVYPQLHYAVLDSLELYNQSKGILYVLSDQPVNPSNPYVVYYLAVLRNEGDYLNATVENFKLLEQRTSDFTGVEEYTASELYNSSYLNTYNANGLAIVQLLFPLEVVQITPMPPIDIYPPCIVPPWWEIHPEVWGYSLSLTTVNFVPRTLVVETEPTFDAKQFIKDETKYHFYRSVLRIPYGAYRTRQSYTEHGLYVLSDAILTAKLKEMSEKIKENQKT